MSTSTVSRHLGSASDAWRLSDLNPATGQAFVDSPWSTLPGHICDALADLYGYTPGGWDADLAVRRAHATSAATGQEGGR